MIFKNPFRTPKKPSVEELDKRQVELGKDLKRLRESLTMEEEVYSAGDNYAEILKKAELDRTIPN